MLNGRPPSRCRRWPLLSLVISHGDRSTLYDLMLTMIMERPAVVVMLMLTVMLAAMVVVVFRLLLNVAATPPIRRGTCGSLVRMHDCFFTFVFGVYRESVRIDLLAMLAPKLDRVLLLLCALLAVVFVLAVARALVGAPDWTAFEHLE